MIKNNIKKMVSKTISKAGAKAAFKDADQACAFFIYQPKMPEALRKANKR